MSLLATGPLWSTKSVWCLASICIRPRCTCFVLFGTYSYYVQGPADASPSRRAGRHGCQPWSASRCGPRHSLGLESIHRDLVSARPAVVGSEGPSGASSCSDSNSTHGRFVRGAADREALRCCVTFCPHPAPYPPTFIVQTQSLWYPLTVVSTTPVSHLPTHCWVVRAIVSQESCGGDITAVGHSLHCCSQDKRTSGLSLLFKLATRAGLE